MLVVILFIILRVIMLDMPVNHTPITLKHPPSLSANEAQKLQANELSKISKKQPTLLEKICKVAQIVFSGLLSIFLYWVNPSLFAIGFVTGILFDDKITETMKKICAIWNAQPWSICVLLGGAALLSLPVTLATCTSLWGSYLGSTLSQESQKELQAQLVPKS
jgi:hypothetical protein